MMGSIRDQLGHHLDVIWGSFGGHIGIMWTSSGDHLGPFEDHLGPFGDHLGVIWASSGDNLGTVWVKRVGIGPNLEILIRVDAPRSRDLEHRGFGQQFRFFFNEKFPW